MIVENYIPGTLKKYGLDYPAIAKKKPGLIYASITGMSLKLFMPRLRTDGSLCNAGGIRCNGRSRDGINAHHRYIPVHQLMIGERSGVPVKVGVAITDLSTGLYTCNGILAALLYGARTGRGQHIDVSLSDVQVASLANIASSALIDPSSSPGRWGTAHPSIVPYQGFRTADGMIMLGGGNDKLFGILCEKILRPELATHERFLTNALRVQHRKELVELIEAETEKETTQQWLDRFEGSGMPYAAVKYFRTDQLTK